jgi:hypothetical protein
MVFLLKNCGYVILGKLIYDDCFGGSRIVNKDKPVIE